MVENWLQTMVPDFQSLLDQHKFTLVEQEDSGVLGRWFAVAASKDMRLRFVGDRGDILVDVSSAESRNQWLDLSLVASLITGRDLAQSASPAELGRFLHDNYALVSRLLSRDVFSRTAEQIRELGEQRATKLFPGGFGDE